MLGAGASARALCLSAAASALLNATEAVLPPTKESPFLPDPVYKLTLHDKLTVYMQCAKFQIVKVYYISKARCQDVEGLVDLQLVEGIQVSLKKFGFQNSKFLLE